MSRVWSHDSSRPTASAAPGRPSCHRPSGPTSHSTSVANSNVEDDSVAIACAGLIRCYTNLCYGQTPPETCTARSMPRFPFGLFTDMAFSMPPRAPTPQAITMLQAPVNPLGVGPGAADTLPAKAVRLSMTRPVTNTTRDRLNVRSITFSFPCRGAETTTSSISWSASLRSPSWSLGWAGCTPVGLRCQRRLDPRGDS